MASIPNVFLAVEAKSKVVNPPDQNDLRNDHCASDILKNKLSGISKGSNKASSSVKRSLQEVRDPKIADEAAKVPALFINVRLFSIITGLMPSTNNNSHDEKAYHHVSNINQVELHGFSGKKKIYPKTGSYEAYAKQNGK